ncbi:MAG: PHP domain-containing protein [Gemmatimonadetes bacterium]|nr:PHP domain-containing protein [Gemmatimonadota bacterium]
MKKFDLHVHSHVSDGRLSPAAVVEAAVAGGLDVIAITDHDTVLGVEEAQAAARAYSLRVIPGVEVSTRHGDHELHILGYWIDIHSPAFLEHQETARRRRADRMQGMVGKLQNMGIPVRYEDVIEAAGPDAAVLARPHLARALLAGGHTRWYGEAFERYINDTGPAFVAEGFPSVVDAIEMIHAAGGLAVWAHPPRDLFDREIRGFADAGIDGVECLRPTMAPADSQLFEAAARELGLLITGGSDWHGPLHAGLGEFFLRPDDIRGFLDAPQSAPLAM